MSDRQDSDKRRKHMAHMDDKRQATTMTVEKMQALLDGATPGPWQSTHSVPADGVECFWIRAAIPFPPPSRGFRVVEIGAVNGPQATEQDANARLIAAAPDLARAYIAQAAELTRLRAKVDALAEALEFYADLSQEGPWHLPSEDYGKRARAALAAYEETGK